MNLSSQHTKVLIVGAGPSGLMMAAQLLRYGVQPIIIDSKQGPTNHTKALAVQARTLEIYRQMDLIDPVLKGGKPTEGLQFHYNGELKGTFPVMNIGTGQTPYPYVFIYPQSKNERVLLSDLTNNAVPVYWNTTLKQLNPGNNSVEATLISGNQEIKITADWIIGADGAHSAVRKQLNIPFNGDTYAHLFYLADVITNHQDDYINLFLTAKGLAGFFPTDEKNGYRVLGDVPENLAEKEDLTLEDILPYMEDVIKANVTINECRWFTTYKLHHRMADHFRLGRCFLIGDAAHIHSAVGGQGMNTGLQDAYNLAWKLAGVINGKLQERVLDSYASERMPVARELLKTTDRAFNLIMSRLWPLKMARRWLLPKALSFLWSKDGIRRNFFKILSQTGINYRHSSLNLHLSQANAVKAGDRLPYYKIFDEKKQEETDLHAWCSKPGFTLILFGQLPEQELLKYARWITHFYGSMLNFFYLPLSTRNQHIFNAFEIKSNQNKAIIVRPDNYIGLVCDSVDIDVMNNYLQQNAGLLKTIG